MRDYPPESIREALLNAIVHRDYSFSESTLISIFEDRIEFVTIGGLVKGIVLDDVMLGVSVLRNQNLANIFYRLRLIEAYGTGILKINECYNDYAVKPMIETTCNAFKITLPNTNFHSQEQKASNTLKMVSTLVQHCVINGEYCTCYFCQHCVVVNQRCHRIASFLRLVLTKISGTLFTIIYAMLY